MKVETQEEADHLNETGTYGPYWAANGHHMLAQLTFPRGEEDGYRVGDEIRYVQWNAWCADDCNHSELGPLEDW